MLDVLSTAEGEGLRRAAKVAPDTLLRVARADQLAADVTTGRGVATAHESVAVELGMCKRTVQRARALLEAMGLAVTIVEGRYLTARERAAARALHGGRQIKAASVRALTVPKRRAVENVHLPRRGVVNLSTPLSEIPTKRAFARRSAASRRGSGSEKRSKVERAPHDVGVQKLAAGVVARMPWLARGAHIGRVCTALTRAGIDPARWTATSLIEKVTEHEKQAGVNAAHPLRQGNPLAYFVWRIRNAIVPEDTTAVEVAAARAAELAAERAEWARLREAERERMAKVDQAEVQRILEQMRRDFPSRPKVRRRTVGGAS
ncbi:hypothetical protein [Amnibacterium flavum]|uniref:hypothetical protein n=1 Tax=Amnibacterium flavum TaxID=2173173 RepID=UPI001057ABBF|nr:hypothetical protein [Amnibacterium flavum]